MKLNNKGFMMAELIVVSAIVLVTLAGMYTSYNKIYSVYKSRISYYDVNTLYRLGFFRDVLVENELLEGLKNTVQSNGIVDITSNVPANEDTGVKEKIFIIHNNNAPIESSIFTTNVNPTFKDYVDYLSGTIENFSDFKYMLIMEKCEDDSDDKCTYTYLEILEPTI